MISPDLCLIRVSSVAAFLTCFHTLSTMRRIGLISLIALVLAISGLPSVAAAPPPKPLKLVVKPIMTRARSQSPQTLDVEILCDSSELFQGRLELKVYLDKRLLHVIESHDLAITAGGQRFRILLPPLVVRVEKNKLAIYGRFVMEKQAIELGDFTLNVPAAWRRSFVVAVVHPQELILPPGKRGIAESLNFEQFNPFSELTFNAQADAQHDLLTNAPRLTPEELPVSAVGYTSFDLLLLEEEAFLRLRPKQLAAIVDWTAAGGSLVVTPSGEMSADHVNFLNRLAGSNPEGEGGPRAGPATYSLSDEGRLVIGEPMSAAGAKFVRHNCGLGRVLAIHERLDPEVDFGTPEWKAAVAFLWKVRDTQTEQILQKGMWNFPSQQRLNAPGAFRPYAPQQDELPRNIRQLLLPERIEGVPLWVVVIILSLYLVVIAPGDYFLLGRLNCRKYTWVFFVLISAAFTGSTVMIANSYMGHADYRTSLVFADLAGCEYSTGEDSTGEDSTADDSMAEGLTADVSKREGSNADNASAHDSDQRAKLARVSRFEMLFTATQRVVEIPARNELYVDITDRAIQPEASHRDRRPFAFADDEEMDVTDAVAADLPVYAGLMPGNFTIEQQMRQWSPRVNRRTTFGHDPDLLAATAIDWKALRPDEWKTPAGRKKLLEAVLAKEPAARVLLFRGTSCYDLVNDGLIEIPRPGEPGVDAQTRFNSLRDSPIVSLVYSASVRPDSGLFAVVSQISPTGGEYLEDLALLDSSDSAQWLLAVVVHRDNNWLVFRKLCRGRRQ